MAAPHRIAINPPANIDIETPHGVTFAVNVVVGDGTLDLTAEPVRFLVRRLGVTEDTLLVTDVPVDGAVASGRPGGEIRVTIPAAVMRTLQARVYRFALSYGDREPVLSGHLIVKAFE